MSMVKTSQIHDGFATIRSRGVQRSRSRVEQLERLKPISGKSDSMPLYENNNNNHINGSNSDLVYSFKKSALNERDPLIYSAAPSVSSASSILDGHIVSSYVDDAYDDKRIANLSTAFASFKRSNGCLNEHQQPHQPQHPDSYCELSKSRTSLPPPSPCYENVPNGFHTPKTPDSLKSTEYFLYSRPTSPLYERFANGLLHDTSSTSATALNALATVATTMASSSDTIDLYSSPSKAFTPTYYRKAVDSNDYALQKVTAKPPINSKSHSLQYRKSYSHPAQTIYESSYIGGMKPHKLERNVKHYYNPSTNYYDPSEIGYLSNGYNRKRNTSTELIGIGSDMMIGMPIMASSSSSSPPPPPPPPLPSAIATITTTTTSLISSPRLSALERRYATLANPKDRLHNRQQQQQHRYHHHHLAANTHSISQTNIDYLDPLDFKVGCQTTLRSKPQIPWYELAIKKDHRRQSCPPFQAHVVAAFEQSLSNMTQRLQQLSATAERKDSELTDMRQTIELLRKQSIQAGLTTAHMQSMGNEQQNNRMSTVTNCAESTPPPVNTAPMQRHPSTDSMCSLNSLSSGCSAQDKKKRTGWLRTSLKKAFTRNAKISKTNRYVSTASSLDQTDASQINLNSTIDSLPPQSPQKCSPHRMVTVIEDANPVDALDGEGHPLVEDLKKQLREKELVLTDIRLEALSSASQLESLKDTVMKMRQEMMNLKHNNERLQKMVTSRSLAGSEVSLGGGNGPLSPNGSIGEPRRYSLADGNLRPPLELPKSLHEPEEDDHIPPAPAPEPDSPSRLQVDMSPVHSVLNGTDSEHLSTPAEEIVEDHVDGKKISIVVYLGQPESFAKYSDDIHESDDYFTNIKSSDSQENGFENKNKSFTGSLGSNPNEFIIAFTYISGKTTWQNLDYIVRKTFKDYLARIDPGTNLGLNTDSITSYHLGDAKRGPEIGFPELLPCGYIIGNVKSLYICLQGVGCLAFDSLIPRSIVHRYISLLTEHRRLILCGPSGTGKSYLARKLAEFLVTRSQRDNPCEAIATFNVDHKSSKELRQYLGHIAEQASMSTDETDAELPSVIILDNLHHASALGDVFQVLLSAGPAAKLPCIIGTMSQATCNTTNLQLHHNFRWVLTANHMEPVKGFLARFLRRRLYSLELGTHTAQSQLASVFAWLPTVWQHINRFLETHSSSDVTIGPRLFLSCPLDPVDSQVWFTDVWNYHLAPYLVEAVREGVQLYGRRGGAWVDPVTFIRESYPWPMPNGLASIPPLRQINAEDVGLEGNAANGSDSQDPLLNMLMRLQEAANYHDKEQESDCASLDSNITQDSSAGAE